jgi:Rps23 Pro-64 3,4-dihydroxylase Tpa1-like proline 4-hydroxylase
MSFARDPAETPIAVLEEFLAPMELAALQAFAAANEPRFEASHVIGPDREGLENPDHRRSRVLYEVDGFHDLMGARILHHLPHVLWRLRMPPFPVTSIELQLTASNDGEFFRPHTDSDDGPVQARTVTFVYFCHREPTPFDGGELRIYGRDPANGVDRADVVHAIRPTQNRIVFFPSDRLHEISTVACPSRAFLDSRMTLNGWVRR